jgi:copper chaperone NosL
MTRLTFKLTTLFSLFATIILIGCAQKTDTNQPPNIVYGQDTCDQCKMIISEENMAAAYWTTEGKAHRFDDIGGMLAYYKQSDDDVASWWVHDYLSGEWLNAENAIFVKNAGNAGIQTPMGFGIVAFANHQSAESFAYGVEGVVTLNFDTLLSETISDHVHSNQNHEDH